MNDGSIRLASRSTRPPLLVPRLLASRYSFVAVCLVASGLLASHPRSVPLELCLAVVAGWSTAWSP